MKNEDQKFIWLLLYITGFIVLQVKFTEIVFIGKGSFMNRKRKTFDLKREHMAEEKKYLESVKQILFVLVVTSTSNCSKYEKLRVW